MSANTHWAENYIGKPWENGAQGPAAFDCWGFVRFVFATERDIDLPPLAIDADKPLSIRHAIAGEKTACRWTPLPEDDLRDFDVILMSQAQHPDHVGLWVGGAVLHCVRGAGVVYQGRASLRAMGWNVVSCYRWRGGA